MWQKAESGETGEQNEGTNRMSEWWGQWREGEQTDEVL
jgi:hypothetical protein